jgi:hypothetical protein
MDHKIRRAVDAEKPDEGRDHEVGVDPPRDVRMERARADIARLSRSMPIMRKTDGTTPTISASIDATKVHRAGSGPMRGQEKDKLGDGPEASAVHVAKNAVAIGAQGPHQHHVFPQERRAWFAARGVDVDDYCITLDQAHHEAVHAKVPAKAKGPAADAARMWEWNNAIMAALEREEKARGRRLNKGEIENVARALMPDYGLKGKFERYKGAR